jgi:ribonucleotide monophosphatase NagD (HAD superfamily)
MNMEEIDHKLIKKAAQISSAKERMAAYINGCGGSVFYQGKSGVDQTIYEIDLRIDVDMAKMMLDLIGILQDEQYELLKEKFYKTK